MSEIRELLRQWLGERIMVRGELVYVVNHPEGIRAYVVKPEMNGEIISDHIFVMKCPHWMDYRHMGGKEIEFEAEVNKYDKPDGSWNFGLRNPNIPRLICPPFMAIPEPRWKRRNKSA